MAFVLACPRCPACTCVACVACAGDSLVALCARARACACVRACVRCVGPSVPCACVCAPRVPCASARSVRAWRIRPFVAGAALAAPLRTWRHISYGCPVAHMAAYLLWPPRCAHSSILVMAAPLRTWQHISYGSMLVMAALSRTWQRISYGSIVVMRARTHACERACLLGSAHACMHMCCVCGRCCGCVLMRVRAGARW